LVRKICPHCKEVAMPDESLLQLVGLSSGREEDRATFEVFRNAAGQHQYDSMPHDYSALMLASFTTSPHFLSSAFM